MTANVRPSFWRRLANSLKAWPGGPASTLDLIPDGFEYTGARRTVRILWHEITQIDAGMRDLLTIDVFFAVVHTPRESAIVDEFVDGFRQLEQGIFEGWPQVRERWLSLQAGPPRQPRFETLWRA